MKDMWTNNLNYQLSTMYETSSINVGFALTICNKNKIEENAISFQLLSENVDPRFVDHYHWDKEGFIHY